MSTIIVYSFLTSVTLLLAYKLYLSNKKDPNDFRKYFLMGVLNLQVAQIFCVIAVILYYLNDQNSDILYWSDVVSRFLFLVASGYFMQMSLFAFWPNSKKRIFATYLYFIVAIAVTVYGLTLRYSPFIDSLGIPHWNTPNSVTYIFAIFQIIPWVFLLYISLSTFVKSHFRSSKSLLLFIGFFLAITAGAIQDVPNTILEFYVVNSVIFLGFLLVFLGLFIKEGSTISTSS